MLQFNKYKREYKYHWRILRTDTDYFKLFSDENTLFFENQLVLFGGLVLAISPSNLWIFYPNFSEDIIIDNKKSYNNNPVLFRPERFFRKTPSMFSTFWFMNKEDLRLFWDTHKKSTFTKSFFKDMTYRNIKNKDNLIIVREKEINNDTI